MATDDSNIPQVGEPATIHSGSDCYPATVIEVSRTGHRVVIQHDTSIVTKRAENYGDDVEYRYERNPEGGTRVYTRRTGKDGSVGYKLLGWPTRSRGGNVGIGYRRMYRDPSF